MKKFNIIFILLPLVYSAMSQNLQPHSSCLPYGISFGTQEAIDSFQFHYPDCTNIEGDVNIVDPYGTQIDNLQGLNVLTSIKGELNIENCDKLHDLSGLNNLTTIGWRLRITNNDALTNLNGLNSLDSIGGLYIVANNSLTSLSGLDKLRIINGNFQIGRDGGLGNPVLTDLSSLISLRSINGELQISSNISLTSLSGLDSIHAASLTRVIIWFNSSLTTCDVKSICENLVIPGLDPIIYSNASGCNSIEEVIMYCNSGIEEDLSKSQIRVFPNPSSDQFSFTFPLEHASLIKLEVINYLGQVVSLVLDDWLKQGEYQTTWNAQGMPADIYFYRLQTRAYFYTGKILVVR